MSFIWFDVFEDEIDEIRRNSIVSTLRRRRSLRMASDPLAMDDILFKTNFRLTKEIFIKLLDDIEPHMAQAQRFTSIPNVIKLACLLRFCAQGSYQVSVGNDYNLGLGQSTVSYILTEMIDIMEDHICPKWIKFNYTREEEEEAKAFFFEQSGFPGIIGCIDGTHIKIRAPEQGVQHLYYNRKGYFSINAMIVCNHKKIIKYVNAKYPGSCHDAMVWNASLLRNHLEEKYRNGTRNTFIFGDAAYPLTPYLIVPFRSTEANSPQSHFNRRHTQARILIEQRIGLLKNRFRCLLGARELHYKPEKVTKIVNVCAALHNISLQYGIEFEETIENEEFDDELEQNDEFAQNNSNRNAAENVRNQLLNTIL